MQHTAKASINQGLFAAGKTSLQHSGSDVTGKDEAGKDGGGWQLPQWMETPAAAALL